VLGVEGPKRVGVCVLALEELAVRSDLLDLAFQRDEVVWLEMSLVLVQGEAWDPEVKDHYFQLFEED